MTRKDGEPVVFEVEIQDHVEVSPSGSGSGFIGLVVNGLRRRFRGFWATDYLNGDAIALELNEVGKGAVVKVVGRKENGKGVEVRVIERVGEMEWDTRDVSGMGEGSDYSIRD